MAPVVPIEPVAPTGPVDPVSPVDPVVPVIPGRPVTPMGPVGPVGPGMSVEDVCACAGRVMPVTTGAVQATGITRLVNTVTPAMTTFRRFGPDSCFFIAR